MRSLIFFPSSISRRVPGEIYTNSPSKLSPTKYVRYFSLNSSLSVFEVIFDSFSDFMEKSLGEDNSSSFFPLSVLTLFSNSFSELYL